MFIQNTSANLRIKVKSVDINVLEKAEKVIVKLKRRSNTIEKEAIIVNPEEQVAICYLQPEDLCIPGNYDYTIEVYVGKKVIKSVMGSFYVNPAISAL